jgi:hypothetical protein
MSETEANREERRERYDTINPELQMVVSEELEAEKQRVLEESEADRASISANGGEGHATIHLEYDIEGSVGRDVFDLDGEEVSN